MYNKKEPNFKKIIELSKKLIDENIQLNKDNKELIDMNMNTIKTSEELLEIGEKLVKDNEILLYTSIQLANDNKEKDLKIDDLEKDVKTLTIVSNLYKQFSPFQYPERLQDNSIPLIQFV